jgi:SAM-dependent methyltransferase
MPPAQNMASIGDMTHGPEAHTHEAHTHEAQAAHTHEGHAHGDGRLSEVLDLDAEVLHEYHCEVMTWVGSLVPSRARIIDLGAGTGTGTLALARQLPDAEIVAVDISAEMLEHLRRKVREAEVAGHVRTVQADLDGPWPDLGPADLIWASASLHHMADPGHALGQALAALRPGGVLVAAELGSFPRFLADDAGAAVEERGHAAMARIRTEAGLHMDEDWGALLAKAGFVVEAERRFDVALQAPLPAAAGRYAQVSLERMRQALVGRVDDVDLAALDVLAAGVPERDDLAVRATRTVWQARRPG